MNRKRLCKENKIIDKYHFQLELEINCDTVVLTRECHCVQYENTDEESFITVDEDCYNCGGTGIVITNNGENILTLMEIKK